MRWLENAAPKLGDVRHKARFLLLPKRIGLEWRWLEWTSWVERYKPVIVYLKMGIPSERNQWVPTAWTK